jgi:hypothetical protein
VRGSRVPLWSIDWIVWKGTGDGDAVLDLWVVEVADGNL